MPIISIDELEQQQAPVKSSIIPIDEMEKHDSGQQPKEFYDTLGANMTDEQKLQHPILAGLHQTAKDVVTGTEKVANAATLGLLDYGLKKSNIQPPNFNDTAPENKSGLNLISDIGGMVSAGETIGKIAKPIIKVASPVLGGAFNKVKSFADDLIHGPEKATAAADAEKFALGQKTAQQIEQIKKIGKTKIDIAKRNADAVSKGYDDLSETLKKQVASYSREEGKNIQKELPKIFGKKSAEYGAEQKGIIDNLTPDQRAVPTDKVVSDMENTLRKFRVLGKDSQGNTLLTDAELTPVEKKVIGMYSELKSNPRIDVEDLMKNQDFIKPDYGKPFEPDDKLKSEIAQIFSRHIENAAPELQALKSRYAPFLEWKNAAINKLEPFNSRYDISTGAVSKVGSELSTGNEKELLAKLTKVYQSPYGSRINALNKGIKTTKLNQEQAAQAAKESIQKLRDSLSKDIQKIRQNKTLNENGIKLAKDRLIMKYRTKQAVAGLGLAGVGFIGGKKALESFVDAFVRGN